MVSISSVTWASHNACEESASLTSRFAFVKLVKSHIEDHTLPATAIAWLIAQPKASNPVLDQAASIHNHSLRKGFRAVLRKLRPKDWPLVVEDLKSLNEQLAAREKSTASAKAETKNIFSLLFERPLTIQAHAKNLFVPTKIFVASNGDMFGMARLVPRGFVAQGQPGEVTYIMDYTRDQLHSVHSQPEGKDVPQFYETHDGRIIFADIAGSKLTVVNARTGVKLIDAMPITGGIDPYPLIYETGGQLKVAIPQLETYLPMDSSHVAFLEIVDVASGTINRKVFDDGLYHAKRLANHHAYIFGLRTVHDNIVDGRNREAVIYDLTTEQYVTITRFRGFLNSDKEVLIEDQGPKMLLFVNGQENLTSGYYQLNATKGYWEKFLHRLHNNIEQFFVDSSNTAWIARFEHPTGLKPKLSFHKINDPDVVVTWSIPTAEEGKVFSFNTAKTPLGQIFIAAEFAGRTAITLHIYNFTTQESYSLPISPQTKLQRIGPAYYVPTENRIFISIIKKDQTWSTLQLWRPDQP